MFFGIGLVELLLVLAVLAAPVVLVVLGVRALSRRSAPGHLLAARNRQLEEELATAYSRIEEMEVKLIGMEEKLSFAHDLLEGPGRAGRTR